MNHESFFVDRHPIDDEITDIASVGAELAYASTVYLKSPRALIWRNPSSDWKLFALLLPIGTRLSLLSNPIFAQLSRAWGLNLRFVGIDAEGHFFDFKALLSDRTLSILLNWLQEQQRTTLLASMHSRGRVDEGLDALFAALASEMLTMTEARRLDWYQHLDCEHRLEPETAHSLFDRQARYPDFTQKLQQGLRHQLFDQPFYGRVLRSMDLREQAIEKRLSVLIEGCLDAATLSHLHDARCGLHLGCYNWLLSSPKHAKARAHALLRLPSFASYLASLLTPLNALERIGQVALGPAVLLQRAIDAGQDRLIIDTLARNLGTNENTIRRLWREIPKTLGQPPAWQLSHVVQQLDDLDERLWPKSSQDWFDFFSSHGAA